MKNIISVCIAWALLISSAVAQVQNPGVVGPNSSVNGHVAVFSGTSGKFITDSGAAPNSGTVTSVTCFGSAITTAGTCTITGQIPGTATNNNATAGNMGEYVESIVAAGSAISLTSGTASNITSVSLTAGDWDVSGIVVFTGNALTQVSNLFAAISTTSAPGGFPVAGLTTRNGTFLNSATPYATTDPSVLVGPVRLSLNGPATVYLIGFSGFAVSTTAAYGQIRARRVR